MAVVGITKRKILKEIGKGPVHGYELSKRLKISLTFVYQHLKDLRKEGFVEVKKKNRKKAYILTTRGKYLLKAIE